jgi:hypothetical protein
MIGDRQGHGDLTIVLLAKLAAILPRNSDRIKMAKVLDEACRLFDEANQDDLINDLHLAWRDQIIGEREGAKYEGDPDGLLLLVAVSREVARIIATLSRVRAAACKARDEVVPQRGRPKGLILTPDIIDTLAVSAVHWTKAGQTDRQAFP